MNSCISEMPGPGGAVKARAPFQAAPMTMPMEASSSSRLHDGEAVLAGDGIDAVAPAEAQLKASASEVEGVIGYQAHTVAPP